MNTATEVITRTAIKTQQDDVYIFLFFFFQIFSIEAKHKRTETQSTVKASFNS